MAWLDDHPPASPQFRCPRRDKVSGVIVVHTAESVMDTVGPDTGAENVANFIRRRDTPGSYHELVDSDSGINLVDYRCEAYQDATGTNRHALSLSFACSYLDWARMSDDRRNAFLDRGVERAVAMAHFVRQQTGIVIPARRIDRDQSTARVPGFISHAERDPARRKDPGNAPGQFPWSTFLTKYAFAMNPATTPPTLPAEEDDDMMFVGPEGQPEVYLAHGRLLTHVKDQDDLQEIAKAAGISTDVARLSSSGWTAYKKGRTIYT